MGMLGWQEYAISDGGSVTRKVKEKDLPLLAVAILAFIWAVVLWGSRYLGPQ